MYDMISTFRMSNLPNISTIWIINCIYIARKGVDIFCAISTLLWKMLSLLCLLQSYFLCCKQALLSNHLLICQQSVQTGFTHTSLALRSCRSIPFPHLRRKTQHGNSKVQLVLEWVWQSGELDSEVSGGGPRLHWCHHFMWRPTNAGNVDIGAFWGFANSLIR